MEKIPRRPPRPPECRSGQNSQKTSSGEKTAPLSLQHEKQGEWQSDLWLDHRHRPADSCQHSTVGLHREHLQGKKPGTNDRELPQRNRRAVARDSRPQHRPEPSSLPPRRAEGAIALPDHRHQPPNAQRLQYHPRCQKASRAEKNRIHRQGIGRINRVGLCRRFSLGRETAVRINPLLKIRPLCLANPQVGVTPLPGHREALGKISTTSKSKHCRGKKEKAVTQSKKVHWNSHSTTALKSECNLQIKPLTNLDTVKWRLKARA